MPIALSNSRECRAISGMLQCFEVGRRKSDARGGCADARTTVAESSAFSEGVDMNIEICREFIELAQCLNFTEAAGNLNITQPALSKHMLALEKEFGIHLLDRSRKGVQLTEGGRILFESASIIAGEYDRAKQRLEQLKEKHPIRIVGHMEDTDIASLVSMTAMISQENNHAHIVFDRSSDDPFLLLANKAIDLFIGYTSPSRVEDEGLLCKPFVSHQLIAVVENDHPLAKKPSIAWSDLRAQTLVKFMSDKTNPAWGQIEAICAQHGFEPKARPVSAGNDVEFFSTPLRGNVLIWKKTQKHIGLLLETGRRTGVPIDEDDRFLVAYAVYRPEDEEQLADFFTSAEEARSLLSRCKDHK